MTTVQAATLVAPHRLEVRDYPTPSRLEPGAVLLRMLASGICGTDKHTFRGETEQYAGTDTRGARRSRSSRATRTSASSRRSGRRGAGVGRAAAGARRPRGARPEPGVRPCRFCRRGFPYYFCRALENYGNSLSAATPRTCSAAGRSTSTSPGTAVFRVPDELPTEVAVLTEIFAVTHSLERAARCRARRAGARAIASP